MKLSRVWVKGFRNLSDQRVTLFPGVNVFWGKNGQGKTNFLELIYFLAALKSFREAKRRETIQFGSDQFELRGEFEARGMNHEVSIVVSLQGRSLKLNGNRVQDLMEYFAKIRAVCFHPQDLMIIQGNPTERRHFVDRLVFQCRPQHLVTVNEFSRVLRQRNALLRRALQSGRLAEDEFGVWNEQFLALATRLTHGRLQILQDLNRRLPAVYQRLSGLIAEEGILHGDVHLVHSILVADDSEAIYRFYHDLLVKKGAEERQRGVTLWGPHLEDFIPAYGDVRAEAYASTGQQKTFIFSLRLTELQMVADAFGEPPLLLIDDLSSELDEKRLGAVVSYLHDRLAAMGEELQVLVTTVSPVVEILKPLGALHFAEVTRGEIGVHSCTL